MKKENKKDKFKKVIGENGYETLFNEEVIDLLAPIVGPEEIEGVVDTLVGLASPRGAAEQGRTGRVRGTLVRLARDLVAEIRRTGSVAGGVARICDSYRDGPATDPLEMRVGPGSKIHVSSFRPTSEGDAVLPHHCYVG